MQKRRLPRGRWALPAAATAAILLTACAPSQSPSSNADDPQLDETSVSSTPRSDSPTSATPTTKPSESESAPADASPADPVIPDGFPLDQGLPAEDGEITVTGPSMDPKDGAGKVKLCGKRVWPATSTEGGHAMLATGASGPELFYGRDLIAYSNEQTAEDVMGNLREEAASCAGHANEVFTQLDSITGHDSLTVGMTYTDGLGSMIYQWTRVGSAVLLVSSYGEGSLDSLPQQAEEANATTAELADHMCTFATAAC